MSKKINITEEKLKRALMKIMAEDIDVRNNYEPFDLKGTPFENSQDGHGESIVGEPSDPTVYDNEISPYDEMMSEGPNTFDDYDISYDNDIPSDNQLYNYGNW